MTKTRAAFHLLGAQDGEPNFTDIAIEPYLLLGVMIVVVGNIFLVYFLRITLVYVNLVRPFCFWLFLYI